MLRLFAVVLVISIPYIEGIFNRVVDIRLLHARYLNSVTALFCLLSYPLIQFQDTNAIVGLMMITKSSIGEAGRKKMKEVGA